MVKRLIQGLLLGLLAANFNAFALGLGEIQLDSALNQPLSAEIKLLSATPEDADSVQVSLASYETFSKIGIDRPSILALLRFNVASKSGGYVIKIDTHDPIREPFLDFILEVNWSSGRVLREYTLLLDPPDLKRAAPGQIQAPAVQPVAAPAMGSFAQERPSARAPKLGGTIAPTDKGGIVYGPVRNGETLWRIAKEMRGDAKVSTQQMLMALFEENPNAFIAGDINRLKRGSVLRLNNPAVIGSISRQQAAIEVAQRTQPQSMVQGADMDGQPMTADSAEAQRPKLKLVTSDTKSSSERMGATVAEGGDSEAMRQELMLALEISEAQRRENDTLKERMGDLQKQLDALKRLVTLKDGDLAQIQQQLTESGEMTESTPAEVGEAVVSVEEAAVAEMPEGAEQVTEPNALVIPDLPEAEEEAIAETISKDQAVVAEEAPMAPQPETIEAKPQPKIAPVIKKQVSEPNFFSSIIAEPMFMTAGGAALALILLLILLIIKKRGNRFHESILSGDASSMGASTTAGPDTSFLSDLAISGLAGASMDADEGEVDPLTEADVYMAYGRTQQAESLLKDALSSNPDRLELKSKLLEVYFTAKDKEQFDAMIADSAEQLQEDDGAWKKILIMGHELSPENPLFEAVPEVEETEGEEIELAEGEDTIFDDVLDIGIDLDELSAEMESTNGEDLDFDLGLDFSDLDDDMFSTATDEKAAPESEEELSSFDLSDLDIEAVEEVPEQAPLLEENEVSEQDSADGGLDFDIEGFDLDEPSIDDEKKITVSESDTDTDTDLDSELDFSLDDLDELDDLESDESPDLSAELSEELSSIDDDLHDIGDLADLSADIDEDDSIDFEPMVGDESSEERALDDLDDIDIDIDTDLELDLTEELALSEGDDEPVLSSVVEETPLTKEGDVLTLTEGSDGLEDFDFDFNSVESDITTDNTKGSNELEIDSDELDDIDDLDFDIIDDDSLDADDLDEFDLDADADLDGGEGDMETKIDLAKAYIEMGDADGARNMLTEVISQGDDDQKQQAQDLLDSI